MRTRGRFHGNNVGDTFALQRLSAFALQRLSAGSGGLDQYYGADARPKLGGRRIQTRGEGRK